MRLPAPVALAAALLGACSVLQYHAGSSFADTLQFAIADDPAAQLDVARMYADPAAYPPSNGRTADPLQAAKWCYILADGPPAPPPPATLQGPSCKDILAATSPPVQSEAQQLARNWLIQPTRR